MLEFWGWGDGFYIEVVVVFFKFKINRVLFVEGSRLVNLVGDGKGILIIRG